jgi:hypothetical protein
MVVSPTGVDAGTGIGTPAADTNRYLAVGSLARCSTAKRSMAPSCHMPCWGPQSWVMSSSVCPATDGGWDTSSNGASVADPSASRYDAVAPVMEVPCRTWSNTPGRALGSS